jgi:hypothetical protein
MARPWLRWCVRRRCAGKLKALPGIAQIVDSVIHRQRLLGKQPASERENPLRMKWIGACGISIATSPLTSGRSSPAAMKSEPAALQTGAHEIDPLQVAGPDCPIASALRSALRAAASASAGLRRPRRSPDGGSHAQRGNFLPVDVRQNGKCIADKIVARESGRDSAKTDAPRPTAPARTIEVHDSKVRRIPSITPDMIFPNCRTQIERQYPQQESPGKSRP